VGLEGIVSKRLSAPYRLGPSRDWINEEPRQSGDDPGAGS
jgi:ATP-dependent DNA ligase